MLVHGNIIHPVRARSLAVILGYLLSYTYYIQIVTSQVYPFTISQTNEQVPVLATSNEQQVLSKLFKYSVEYSFKGDIVIITIFVLF